MSNKHGDFVWYELMTTDAEKATAFYTSLLNWQTGEGDYRMIEAVEADTGDRHGIGGILQLTPGMQAGGARPTWVGYIGVSEIDACLAAVERAGGSVLMPVRHIPDAGPVAMVTDPQGVPFYLIEPEGTGESLAFASDRPRAGHCAWNELVTTDQNAAMNFYTTLFRWQHEDDMDMDMGPMGTYSFLRHGSLIGAIMTKPEQMPMPAWNHYFRVADIDAAAAGITAGGGQLTMPPQEIPGGDYRLQGIDPCGAAFSLVGTRLTGGS